VKVTAKWGWLAVPDAVQQATLFLANQYYKTAREAPLGVAGFGDFGAVRVRAMPQVENLLQPLRKGSAGDSRFRVA
jgi:hypothetical protein